MKFVCSSCSAEHDLSELSFGADAPDQWSKLTESERNASELVGEQCVIETTEGQHFFIRALLEIPVRGQKHPFTWGVWCSLSEKSFMEMADHWTDPGRVNLGPYFGWLCTRIPEYQDTMFLKCSVHQQEVGLRPLVMLEPTQHQLSVHQQEGIQGEELKNLVVRLLHGTAAQQGVEGSTSPPSAGTRP